MAEQRDGAGATRPSPEGEVKGCDPLSLLLDPENPRLRRSERGSSQPELLRIMIERFKVEELARSIIAGGYYPFDPIVAYEQGRDVIVREGNRRVAAMKLLLRPALAPPKHAPTWRALSDECGANRAGISRVELRVYHDRDAVDLTAYIGFRHVTGVLKWPALEKAGFIAQMIQESRTFDQIAKRIGSYPRHVERHFVAYRMVSQAIDEGIPGAESMEDRFGVLLRALQSPDILDFLAITYTGDPADSQSPVPADHMQQLRDFVLWTFGTAQEPAVLTDSRDLTRWGTILTSARAVDYLRRTERPDFERAWLRSGGQEASLKDSLYVAADRLQESVALVSEHRNSDEVREAVRQCTSFLVQILRYFPGIAEQYGVHPEDV